MTYMLIHKFNHSGDKITARFTISVKGEKSIGEASFKDSDKGIELVESSIILSPNSRTKLETIMTKIIIEAKKEYDDLDFIDQTEEMFDNEDQMMDKFLSDNDSEWDLG